MKASSQDLREKVLWAVDQGYRREEIVKLLGVCRATSKRYLRASTRDGTVATKAIAGRLPKKLGLLQAHDDLRLEEHCQLCEQTHGVQVSTATMSRAIKRVGWTRKKRRWLLMNVVRKSGTSAASSRNGLCQIPSYLGPLKTKAVHFQLRSGVCREN